MPKKRYTPEEIIQHLRTVELETGKGLSVLDACRKVGITEQTYYRWKKEYGGLRVDQAKRLKGLEQENLRLKRIVADQALDLSILKEVTAGNFEAGPPARSRGVRRHRASGDRAPGVSGDWSDPVLLSVPGADLPKSARKNSDKYLKDGVKVEIYNMRSARQPDGLTTDDEFAPYIFNDGGLVGIGWQMLGGPKSLRLAS